MKRAKKITCFMLTVLYVLSMSLTCFASTAAEMPSTSKDFASFYVDNNGSDSNDGSKQTPFQTIQKAKDAVSALISGGKLPKGGAKVYLREGTYYIYDSLVFGLEDSGNENGKITYTAYPGENVRLSGAKPIDQSWFMPLNEEEKARIIDQSAAEKVLVADLRGNGITEYGVLNTRGYHYFNKGQYMASELIVNGENQTLARYPNVGTIPVNNKYLLPDEMSFNYDNDRPSSWVNAKDAWICGTLSINYENNYYPIDSINAVEKKIKLKEGKIKTYYTNGWYFAENLMEELDQVGEYYIDREAGKLYYLPSDDFNTKNNTIELSTIGKPLFYFNGAKNISITNMTIEGGRGYAALGTTKDYKMMTYGEFLIKNNMTNPITFDPTSTHFLRLADPSYYPEAQVFPGHIWDGFLDDGVGVEGIEFKNCQIRNFGQGGLIFRGTKIKIESNEIKNIGGTGIFMTGGDYETLTSSENTIISNSIHRVGYQHRAYNPAIALQGVGCRVAYNDVYDGPHCILNFAGNDHIFEYNKIHDAVKECLDMDAIYTRNEISPQQRGTVIRNNYIYNLGIYPVGEYTKQFNVCGIRTDNNVHALQIYNNIFANIGSNRANNVVSIRAQGTRNTIKGNLFLDCSATYWGFDSYKPTMTWNTEDAETNRRLELVKSYALNPIYAAKYPELITFDKEFYAAVATNTFDENLTVNVKFPLSTISGTPLSSGARGAEELLLGTNNITMNTDPGFVAYSSGDYELNADGELLKQIPYYKNHSMDEFGPKGFSAEFQAENLKDYLFNLGKESSNKLLVSKLDDVISALGKNQYKQALVKLKVFMAKAMILEPNDINKEQFDFIMSKSLDICITICEEYQNKDSNVDNKKIEQFVEFLKNFIKAKDKSERYNYLIDKIDAISDIIL